MKLMIKWYKSCDDQFSMMMNLFFLMKTRRLSREMFRNFRQWLLIFYLHFSIFFCYFFQVSCISFLFLFSNFLLSENLSLLVIFKRKFPKMLCQTLTVVFFALIQTFSMRLLHFFSIIVFSLFTFSAAHSNIM